MIKSILATHKKAEDLINIGAYVKGSNPKIDQVIDMLDDINAYLCQGIDEQVSYDEGLQLLMELTGGN